MKSLLHPLFSVLILPGLTFAAQQKPNVVLIVADDLGWADVSYHGSTIPTPNIDALCKAGVELDQHYVTPLCTPTRVCLLTGRYSSRFGNVSPANARVLPWGTVTLATVLKDVGYTTAITGKWHLGSLEQWGPMKFGFTRSHGSLAGGVGPYNHLYKKGPYQITWHRNDKLKEEEGHVTDLIARECVAVINAKRDGPFLLYAPFTAVHDPFFEPERYLTKVAHVDEGRRQYAASAVHLDAAIGRIVAALKETGQFNRTMIIFFSDNGGTRGEGGKTYSGEVAFSAVQGSNKPLRGGKRNVYQGGVRTPAFAVWNGHFPTGTKITAPLHACDWLPTLAKLTGFNANQDLKFDGQNILPILRGELKSPPPRTIYCKSIRGQYSLHHADWKLVVVGKNRQLYNLADDPNETKDLATANPDKVDLLAKLLAAEQKKDNDAPPDRKKD